MQHQRRRWLRRWSRLSTHQKVGGSIPRYTDCTSKYPVINCLWWLQMWMAQHETPQGNLVLFEWLFYKNINKTRITTTWSFTSTHQSSFCSWAVALNNGWNILSSDHSLHFILPDMWTFIPVWFIALTRICHHYTTKTADHQNLVSLSPNLKYLYPSRRNSHITVFFRYRVHNQTEDMKTSPAKRRTMFDVISCVKITTFIDM